MLDAEVVSKAKKPTEAEAKKFYDDNTEKIPGTYAETKVSNDDSIVRVGLNYKP